YPVPGKFPSGCGPLVLSCMIRYTLAAYGLVHLVGALDQRVGLPCLCKDAGLFGTLPHARYKTYSLNILSAQLDMVLWIVYFLYTQVADLEIPVGCADRL